MFRKSVLCLLFLVMLTSAASYSVDARAELSDRAVFVRMALYGIAVGTAMGLVATPLTQNPRAIFIGTSVGLYLGTVGSIYHMTHRDDPGNPFSPANSDYSQAPKSIIAFSVPVVTF